MGGRRTEDKLIIKIFYLYSGVKHPRCGLFGRDGIHHHYINRFNTFEQIPMSVGGNFIQGTKCTAETRI